MTDAVARPSVMDAALGCPPAVRLPRRWTVRRAEVARSLAAALLAGALGGEAGVVYRSLDAEGLPVFSDVPPVDAAGEAVRLAPANAFAVRPTPAGAPDDVDAAAAAVPSYAAARVVAPAAGAAVRANDGVVRLRGEVSPPLRTGHRAVLFVDGARSAEAAATGEGTVAFTLTDVARGRHQAHIDVVDGNGRTLLRGAPSVFHVQRVALGR